MGFQSACKLLVLVVVLLAFVGDWDVVLGDSGKGVKDEKNLFGGGAGGGGGLGGGAGGGGGL
ncbi:hypothetical protein Tco_0374662, partial [Tanacetum coccineum]